MKISDYLTKILSQLKTKCHKSVKIGGKMEETLRKICDEGAKWR